jgi:hypothetical protein
MEALGEPGRQVEWPCWITIAPGGKAVKWAIIENIVTMVATAALVLGLYSMGAGGYAFFGLLLLTNINTSYQSKEKP